MARACVYSFSAIHVSRFDLEKMTKADHLKVAVLMEGKAGLEEPGPADCLMRPVGLMVGQIILSYINSIELAFQYVTRIIKANVCKSFKNIYCLIFHNKLGEQSYCSLLTKIDNCYDQVGISVSKMIPTTA